MFKVTDRMRGVLFETVNPLAPNDIRVYTSYRTADLQTLHFKYLLNKYTY